MDIVNKVSILVLVDYRFEQEGSTSRDGKKHVSILVLVDYRFEQCFMISAKGLIFRVFQSLF